MRADREFRFRHSWEVTAHPSRVYDVLVDVARYPQWWPQVLAVARIDDRSGRAVCRSLAPFDLELVLRSEVEDPVTGLLRVGLSGDLEGWCSFRPEPAGGVTHLYFDQSVRVRRPGLRRAAQVLAPAMRANHAWMMRGCRRGLDRHLSGAR